MIDQHRDLAAVEHVVAEARPRRPGIRVGGVVEHPLVDALVAAAGEHQPRLGRPARAASRLGERRARRASGTTSRGGRRRRRRAERPRRAPRPTARAASPCRPAAVRGVVDGAVPVVGPVAQVVHAQVEQPVVAALPISESRSGARYSGKIVTTSTRTSRRSSSVGTSVEQARRRVDQRPRRRRGRPRARSPRRTAPAPRCRPAGRPRARPGRAGAGPRRPRRPRSPSTVRDRAGRPAGGRRTRPGPRAARPGRRRRRSRTLRRRLGGVAVVDALEAQQQPAAVHPAGRRWSADRPTAGSVRSTAPGASRASGSSVRTSTVTSPRMPCGRPIRPTTTSTTVPAGSAASARRRRRSRRGRRGRPSAPTTVRSALAVRPPRPMTLPRSSGCTRTSRMRPRRLLRSRT